MNPDNQIKIIDKKSTLRQRMAIRIYMYLAFRITHYKESLSDSFLNLKAALANESEQTKEMLQVYLRRSIGEKVTRQEMSRANSQFRDLFKSAGLGVILFLPFSPITLPFLIRLGEKLGIDILPDSVRAVWDAQTKKK
ncbi:MAG: hypothetical protein KDD58_14100 [Bdellovibrionales bacterium]|nr:hypothetical protein [Bdellovibrionales bacterium]